MNLAEVVITVHQRLDELGISHAFGGALALQYVGDPRMTLDVDQIEHQLIALRGPTMYPRIVRLRAMLREAAG